MADILLPTPGTILTTTGKDVVATVTNPSGTLIGWWLDISTADGGWQKLVNGTTAKASEAITTLDPLALPDGTFTVRLTAYDTGGVGGAGTDTTTVTISAGRLKLGDFSVKYTDLVIPVAGIPVTVNRIYDTQKANQDTEFGHGWRLDVNGYGVEIDPNTTDGGNFLAGITRVYVKYPDGRKKDGFTYNVAPYQSFTPDKVPVFIPDAGVGSRIEIVGAVELILRETSNPYYVLISAGAESLDLNPNDAGLQLAFRIGDPVTQLISTVEAKANGTGQMLEQEDRNGNHLFFNPDGIESKHKAPDAPAGTPYTAGPRVTYTFDRNHIVAVTDPRNKSIRYGYDEKTGNLQAVTDRTGRTVTMSYDPVFKHHLDEVIAPNGETVGRTEYDATGRKSRTVNPDNSFVTYTYDSAARTTATTRSSPDSQRERRSRFASSRTRCRTCACRDR